MRTAMFACGLLAPLAALSQDAAELQRLIFEPAPIPAGSQQQAEGDSAASSSPADSGAPRAAATAADAGDDARIAADIARYQERIGALVTEESPYSVNLREQYSALGLLQQQYGDHEAAILSFENAMHIDRVNEGLFTVNQIPLVESIIASHAALGNFSAVDDHHEYLYYIQLKSYPAGDPRLLAAKEAWADWNVEAYLKQGLGSGFGSDMNFSTGAENRNDYVAIQHPTNGSWNYVPRNQLPFVLNPNGMATNAAVSNMYANSLPYAVTPEMMVDARLRKARDLYEEIRAAREESGVTVSDSDPFSAEHKLANIAYAVKQQFDRLEAVANTGSLGFNRVMQPRTTATVVSRGYTRNRENLEAIATRLEQDPASSARARAQAWIDVGDWHISFERTTRGEEAYAKAWTLLHESGMDAAAIAAVFHPAPVTLVPPFAIHQYSRALYGLGPDVTLEYKGYMDVTLGIDRNGRVRSPRIDEVSDGTGQLLRSKLLDFLRESRMRPALVENELVTQEDLKIRFHYTY